MLRLMMALESLLYESQPSNLTQAQNELPAFTHIFWFTRKTLTKNSSTHKLAINKYFFLGFSVFQVVAYKGWWCGWRLLSVCLHTRKSIQPQHKRHSLPEKWSFKGFLPNAGNYSEPFFYKYMCFGLFLFFRAFSE